MFVHPKKHLGQHFLTDTNLQKKIVRYLEPLSDEVIIEIGPGQAALTKHLLAFFPNPLIVIEKDKEAVEWLKNMYPNQFNIIEADVLKVNYAQLSNGKMITLIGNLPYNISSPIFFEILKQRQWIRQAVCMVQKEVAERIISPPGTKNYGVLSVLLDLYYERKLVITVPPQVFVPPPKVKSAVLVLNRKEEKLPVSFEDLRTIVNLAFNQRRKTLRNSLATLQMDFHPFMGLRPEQITPLQFVELCHYWKGHNRKD
ncbi:MAG: 16S rRNA (adenine(1518)-N(6)/adenine(1519)-N(6))-dimethyltransferase RsmA [Bacteroidia bacterium]|nr:16S rRNA (adenine(1518)-N(6)/adenine(1519)-N(6))-dimethyltransferase RsmA [Bacteroidia bacterium]